MGRKTDEQNKPLRSLLCHMQQEFIFFNGWNLNHMYL